MKKIISSILCLILALSVMPVGVYAKTHKANEFFTSGKLEFYLKSDNTLLCSGLGTYKKDGKVKYYQPEKIVIPSKVDGYKVTEIYGFNVLNEGKPRTKKYDCIKSVEIPDTVISISDSFEGCKGLKKVKLSKNIKYIEFNAFGGTPYQKANTKNGVFYAGKYLINVYGKNKTLKVKDGTALIANYAFQTDWLESITLSKTVKYFGAPDKYYTKQTNTVDAYYQKPELRSRKQKLKSINVDKENKKFASKNGVLYSKDMTKLICYPSGKENKAYTVPGAVTSIEQYALFDCQNLEYIKLNEGLKTIKSSALRNLKNLKSLIIPKSVTKIESGAVGYIDDKDGLIKSKTEFAVYKGTEAEKYMTAGYDNELTGKSKLNWSYVCSSHSPETKSGKASTYFSFGYKNYTVCKTCRQLLSFTETKKKKLSSPKFTVKAGKKELKVKYNKVKDATGFQVKFTKNGKSKTKTFKTSKSATKAIKNLSKGKYNVKVRAYVQKGSKKAYSSWSKTKTVKIK